MTRCAPPAGDGSETSSTTSTLEQQQEQQELPQASTPATAVSTSSNGTSASTDSSNDKDAPKHLDWVPDGSSLAPLQFTPLSGVERGWANFKLAFALPWRRFKVSNGWL